MKHLLILSALVLTAHAIEPLPMMDTVKVGGIELSVKALPKGLKARDDLGLVMADTMDGQVVHRTQTRILETRATITPKGDYLLMFPEGDHYAKSKGERINTMMACRSSDKGKTWSPPVVAYDIPYSQHGFIPLIPRGTQRIYAFGTQPVPGKWHWEDGQRENAPIGYRWSDDDGHTWSDVKLIAPTNDPDFKGMSVMRMTETDAGTWLVGSHLADWSVKPFTTQQYLLRSEDKGGTWTVLPTARPKGWQADGFDRMDEGRPLNLGGGKVLFMSRTPQGHLFTAWSDDDGKSWTKPAPSTLVHPDAPPMVFPLSNGRTLVAFHHNKVPVSGNRELDDKAENMKVRSEIWVAFSHDGGHTWSAPRFVFANAVQPVHAVSGFNSQCSYLDAFVDGGIMHLFLPHRWQQVLHLTINEKDLPKLPTKATLAQLSNAPLEAAPKASAKVGPAVKLPVYAAELAQKLEPTRKVVYKKVGGSALALDIFEPAGLKKSDKRACFLAFHGGGWTSGGTRVMYPFTDHCAKEGMVAISAQYRLYKPKTEVTVFGCVKDARAALRYVRAHAPELGIDPDKIIVNGASAGGHLAAATAMFDGVDHADEDLKVSCHPNAMVLFSPVIDTSKEGYGNAKIGERWKELSPAHQVRAGLPPTLLFHGETDTTTPFAGAQLFEAEMRKTGNRIERVTPATGGQHTYMFKDAALYAETQAKMDSFFASLGMLAAPKSTAASTGLRLPSVISDHMILQASTPATIWGWAKAGQEVTVEFASQKKTAKAGQDSRWEVKLDAMKTTSKPGDLLVSDGKDQKKITDVLVGEVWLASGQSNMEMQINGKMHGAVDNAEAEIAAATHPEIRMFMPDVPYEIYQLPVPPDAPAQDAPGRWFVCSPETVADFSAIGYFVARDLAKHTGGPVGVLSAAVGGTPIEAWTTVEAQRAVPAFAPLLADWQKRLTNYDPQREQTAFLAAKEKWNKTRAEAAKNKQPAPKAPAAFKNNAVMKPGGLYNGVIAPLISCTVRGVLWYQGERNAAGPFTDLYGEQLKTLVKDWREQMGADVYFAWVQIAGFQKTQSLPSEPKGWGMYVRDGQRQALSVPRTGMACTVDLGGEKAGHPTNKAAFASRLSAVVLHDVYHADIPIWSGPLLKDSSTKNGQVVLTFDHAQGLKAKDGKLQGFALAGEDQKFVWAEAKIDNDRVILSSDQLTAPKAVRYSWGSNPIGNLVNAAGLPASPFRTDDWPLK